jgi:hypothetical protein
MGKGTLLWGKLGQGTAFKLDFMLWQGCCLGAKPEKSLHKELKPSHQSVKRRSGTGIRAG